MFDFITHYSLTLLSAAVTFAMGVVLLMLSIPYTKEWTNFRRMRSILAATCIILSVVNFASCMADQEDENPQLLSSITLLMSSYQALLFTTAVLTFIRQHYIYKIVSHVIGITAVGAVLFISLYCFPHIYPYIFWVAVSAYVVQLCYCTYVFRREYRECVKSLESFYDDEMSGRLRWVRNCFYSALAVGILALFFSAIPVSIDVYGWFIFIFTIYYVYITCCVINYRVNAGFIIRALDSSEASSGEAKAEETSTDSEDDLEVVLSREKEYVLRQALNVWIEQKRYTEKDTNIDDIARELGTSQRLLSAHFSKYEKVSFRAWRNKLRIEEACRMLREEDDVQLKSLNDLVGMGDYSYFYKQFKLATGMSPTDYREKYYHPAIVRNNKK